MKKLLTLCALFVLALSTFTGCMPTGTTTQTSQGSTTSSIIMIVLWIVIIVGFFYFMIIRPQKKEQKKMQALHDSMEVGDCVLTTSGFYGIIIDITEDTVIVEFGNNKNCRIPMQKAAITQVEKAESAD